MSTPVTPQTPEIAVRHISLGGNGPVRTIAEKNEPKPAGDRDYRTANLEKAREALKRKREAPIQQDIKENIEEEIDEDEPVNERFVCCFFVKIK